MECSIIMALQKENAELKRQIKVSKIQAMNRESIEKSKPVMDVSIIADLRSLKNFDDVILKLNKEYSDHYTLYYDVTFNLV